MISRKNVQCKLCYLRFNSLTVHLKKKHRITVKKYLELFPEANITSSKLKNKFSDSRRKYLEKNEFIPPIFLMNEERKQLWRNKISKSVRETMKNPAVLKKMVMNRKNYEAWNKGLKTPLKSKKKRLETINKNFTKEERSEWARKAGLASAKSNKNRSSISKIETEFLNQLENKIYKKVHRQYQINVDGFQRLVDGYIFCFYSNIIIEIDGCYWHNYPIGLNKDLHLDDWCSRNKTQIFRFWDKNLYDKKERNKCLTKVFNYIYEIQWLYECNEGLTNINFDLSKEIKL